MGHAAQHALLMRVGWGGAGHVCCQSDPEAHGGLAWLSVGVAGCCLLCFSCSCCDWRVYLFPVLLGSQTVLLLILVVSYSIAANPSHPLLVDWLVARLCFQLISIMLLPIPHWQRGLQNSPQYLFTAGGMWECGGGLLETSTSVWQYEAPAPQATNTKT